MFNDEYAWYSWDVCIRITFIENNITKNQYSIFYTSKVYMAMCHGSCRKH